MNIFGGVFLVVTIFYICTSCGYIFFNTIFGHRWRSVNLTDRAFGSFLFGSFLLSGIIFILNLFYEPIFPMFASLLISFVYTLVHLKVIKRFIRKNISTFSRIDYLFVIIFLLIIVDIFYRSAMVSDGLFWWGFKARIISSGPGFIRNYLSDSVFIWSHMDYPFYLPLIESWVYTFFGRIWEPYGALVSAGFYVLLGTYIYLFIRKISSGFMSLSLSLFFLFTPLVAEVSVMGYADLILSFFYLISSIFIFKFIKTKHIVYLLLSLFIASGLFWIKKEGIILFGIYSLVFIFACFKFKVRKYIWWLFVFSTPFIMWFLLLRFYQVSGVDFVTPSLLYLKNNLQRIIEISVFIRRFLKFMPFWGLFWVIFVLLFIYRIKKIKDLSLFVLILFIGIPLIVYPSLFIFSTWIPYYEHVRTSLPRLILQVYPLAYVLFVMYFFDRYPKT